MKSNAEIPPETGDGGPFQKVAECLYRHKTSGRYYALVKRAGKQYRRSLKTTDRKLAERSLSDFRQKVGRLDHGKSRGKVTFAEVAKQWLGTVTPQLKPSSARRRETSVEQINRHLGPVLIRNLTSAVCGQWAGKRGPAVAASTYNNERDTIIAVLAYAQREGLLLDNPATILRRRKMSKAALVIPMRDQFAKLVATLRSLDSRYREAANLVELLGYSGMRLAEATAFRWADVDFENGRFTVTGGEAGTKNLEARTVPLFPVLREYLERERAAKQPEDSLQTVVSIGKATKAMEKACRAAGLPRFTHHSMRHFFVSNAIEAGVDFKTIAAWVGHKDGGLLVAKTYGHLRDSHSFEMAKRMTFSAHVPPVPS